MKKKHKPKLALYTDQESTGINDSESDTNIPRINKYSHHSRIKDKLKLLKRDHSNIPKPSTTKRRAKGGLGE
jgi:hypothetical protein